MPDARPECAARARRGHGRLALQLMPLCHLGFCSGPVFLSASFLFASSAATFFKLLWVFAGYWIRRFWCCHGCMGWVATLAPPSMAAPRVTVTDVLVLLFYGLFISMVSVFVAGPKLLPVKYFSPTIFDLTHKYCIG